MMAPTHVLVGLVFAAAVARVDPALGIAAAVGGIVGGFAPDLDMVAGQHRRTLHAPVLGFVPALAAGAVALARPTPLWVALAVGFLAAAVHSASDVLGGGRELRPWERTNPHGVYCHAMGRWLRARYVVPYDGSPRDALLAALLAVPVVVTFAGPVRYVAVGLVFGGVLYALVRKRVPEYVEPYIE
jgi:membrane-bound metal-dependent hydrolase YbcI (DUF457 family)